MLVGSIFLVLSVYLKIYFNTKYSVFSARYIWHPKFLMTNLLVTLFRVPFLIVSFFSYCCDSSMAYGSLDWQIIALLDKMSTSSFIFHLLPWRSLQYVYWPALQVYEFFWALYFLWPFPSVPDNCLSLTVSVPSPACSNSACAHFS